MAQGLRYGGSRMQAVGLALFGLALCMRLLVPPGWMPAGGSGLGIVLCGGIGTVEASVDHAAMGHATAQVDRGDGGHDKAPTPGATMDQPCAFAGLSAALAAPFDFANLIPPVLLAAAVQAIPAVVAIGRGLAAPPPPSTGPPATF